MLLQYPLAYYLFLQLFCRGRNLHFINKKVLAFFVYWSFWRACAVLSFSFSYSLLTHPQLTMKVRSPRSGKKDAAPPLPKSLRSKLLYTVNEAESWQLENKYLLGYYRMASNSYWSSFHSLRYLHNETSNVYTHLIGAVLFLSWAVQTYNDVLRRYTTSDFNDLLSFGVFFTCAVFCFGSSALFHLFMNHSEGVSKLWLLLDYYGIFALITATIFSGTYYAFYCESFWWKVYSTGVLLHILPANFGLHC